MSITPETLSVIEALRRDLNQVVDRRVDQILTAYAAAWESVAPGLAAAITAAVTDTGRITKATLTHDRGLAEALDHALTELARLATETARGITADLGPATTGATAGQGRVLGSQLPNGHTTRIPAQGQIDEIIRRAQQRIHKATLPLPARQIATMKAELIRGVAAGSNPRETATRIMARTERAFVGGWSRAENIARTETLDAYRRAQEATDRANRDVVAGWVWLCALSPRSCPACIARHGTRHPVDEPGPEGHQRCRCTRVTVTKSWRDLGINAVEPDDVFPDAGAWFERLVPEAQRDILGPARYSAWQRGEYPMSEWARKQQNPGWRSSWVTSPIPAGAK